MSFRLWAEQLAEGRDYVAESDVEPKPVDIDTYLSDQCRSVGPGQVLVDLMAELTDPERDEMLRSWVLRRAAERAIRRDVAHIANEIIENREPFEVSPCEGDEHE